MGADRERLTMYKYTYNTIFFRKGLRERDYREVSKRVVYLCIFVYFIFVERKGKGFEKTNTIENTIGNTIESTI